MRKRGIDLQWSRGDKIRLGKLKVLSSYLSLIRGKHISKLHVKHLQECSSHTYKSHIVQIIIYQTDNNLSILFAPKYAEIPMSQSKKGIIVNKYPNRSGIGA